VDEERPAKELAEAKAHMRTKSEIFSVLAKVRVEAS
jgi:hypothetical protein